MPGFDKSMRGKMNELYNSVENGDATPTPYSKLDGKDDVEDTKPLDDTQLSSFSGAVLNTFNTMVGVGTLSLPFALRHGGWVMLGLLFVVYILGIQAARLIGIMMDDDSTLKSYPNIAEKAFGTKGKTLVAIVFSIELFCACGMFMVLAGDTLHSLFSAYLTTNICSWELDSNDSNCTDHAVGLSRILIVHRDDLINDAVYGYNIPWRT